MSWDMSGPNFVGVNRGLSSNLMHYMLLDLRIDIIKTFIWFARKRMTKLLLTPNSLCEISYYSQRLQPFYHQNLFTTTPKSNAYVTSFIQHVFAIFTSSPLLINLVTTATMPSSSYLRINPKPQHLSLVGEHPH